MQEVSVAAIDHCRAESYDASKLESPELEGFAQLTQDLKGIEYGSDAYRKNLEALKPTIDHHQSRNRHHPEHWPNGIADMTLIDLIEMVCDWKSATLRNKNGNMRRSIQINGPRFNISPQLMQIFESTMRELFQD